jgi:hypothetical protein
VEAIPEALTEDAPGQDPSHHLDAEFPLEEMLEFDYDRYPFYPRNPVILGG